MIYPAINLIWTRRGHALWYAATIHHALSHTHTHVNGHEQASAPPFLVRLGWEVYIKTDSKCIYNTAPGMMIKDPWGSMATKHTLRMLGVSEAEMPHIRHISLRRRLSDWRFLLLSRILQSGTSREQSNGGWMNKWHTGAKDTWTVWILRFQHDGPLLPFNSPCPILPSLPITTLQGTDVICTSPKHQSHSFCRPSRRTEPFFLRALRNVQWQAPRQHRFSKHSEQTLEEVYRTYSVLTGGVKTTEPV